MPTAKVRNLKNNEVGDVELSDAIFGVELNESLIHAAVRPALAAPEMTATPYYWSVPLRTVDETIYTASVSVVIQ